MSEEDSKTQSLTESTFQTQTKTSKLEASNDFEESQQEQFEATIAILGTRTKKLIVPFFLMVALAALILAILGFACAEIWDDYVSMLIMLTLILLTICGALLGAYGIYKWGTVMMEIDRLSGENRKYEAEIGVLDTNVNHLKQNVSGIKENVDSMKAETNDLNAALHEFDDLRKDLKEVAGKNEVFFFSYTLFVLCAVLFACMFCVMFANIVTKNNTFFLISWVFSPYFYFFAIK